MILRTSAAGDVPALRRLWELAFGDSQAYMDCFFHGYYSPERMLVLEAEGAVQCMCAWFDMPLVDTDGACRPAAYLYAVATHPDSRGMGYAGRLLKWAGEWLGERGFDWLTTVPAQPGLHDFFRRNGFEERFRLHQTETVPGAAAPAELVPIEAAEYREVRERMLAGIPHVDCGLDGILFQQRVCRLSGGGLYRVGGGCACVERAEDTAVVKELLAPEKEYPAILAALAKTIPTRRWLVRTPCTDRQEGIPFAMLRRLRPRQEYRGGEDAYFGLAFD